MKIKKELLPRQTIEAFAEEHDLTMVVCERPHWSQHPQFYASFDRAEVGVNGTLRGVYGNGGTHEEAVAAYGPEISEQLLVIDARGSNRREIRVPIIVAEH